MPSKEAAANALDVAEIVEIVDDGFVVYHDDESGGDHREKVSGSQFKRYKCGADGLILVIGALFWIEVARRSKNGHTQGVSPETNAE